jgi:hypothetical protein
MKSETRIRLKDRNTARKVGENKINENVCTTL